MKITFFKNGKIQKNKALISKYGILRVKVKIAEELGFINRERWIIGTEEGENPITHIYVVRYADQKEKEEECGWQMNFINKSWNISFKTVVNELKLKVPILCIIKKFRDDEYDGFSLKLPQPLMVEDKKLEVSDTTMFNKD